MSRKYLDTEFRRYILRVQVDGKVRGAAFYAAPGRAITCAHVVGNATKVQLVPADNLDGSAFDATVVARSEPGVHGQAPWPFPDLAVLDLTPHTNHLVPPLLAAVPEVGQECVTYGFPPWQDEDLPKGSPRTFIYEGREGNKYLLLKGGEAKRGLSGAPLLCPMRRAIVGVVAVTRKASSDLGGAASPLDVLLSGGQYPPTALPASLAAEGLDIARRNRSAAKPYRRHWQKAVPKKIGGGKAALIIGSAVVLVVAGATAAYGWSSSNNAPSSVWSSTNALPAAESSRWSPLQVAYVSPLLPEPGDLHFVVPQKLGNDPAEFGKSNISELYQKFGGIPVGLGRTKFTLTNTTNQTIRIVDMSVTKDCGSPYHDTVFSGWSQGGSTANIMLGINLDSARPVVQAASEISDFDTIFTGQIPLQGSDYFIENTVNLDAGEMQSFTLGAFTERNSCTFKIRVFAAATGHPTVYADIGPSGQQSFKITAPIAKPGNNQTSSSGFDVAYYQNEDATWLRDSPGR